MFSGCPLPSETAVKWKLQKYGLVAVKAERGRHFGKREQDLWGDPRRDRAGRRSSQVRALAGGDGMVVAAFGRQVAVCCLLRASSLDHFAPGQVVCSVSLYFIGTTPATRVKLSWLYG